MKTTSMQKISQEFFFKSDLASILVTLILREKMPTNMCPLKLR